MKHKVFISYSRKDTKTVDKICKVLDDCGITYFIDRAGISGGLEFPEIIVKAIEECEVFLFIGSKNAYASRYVSNEVTYAYNVKAHNTIIPYLIDNTPLPGSLQFIFGNVNYRKIKEHPIETVLIQDIKGLLKLKDIKIPCPTTAKSNLPHKIFKGRNLMLYTSTIVQIALLLTAVIFFSQLLKPGWGYIGKHPGSVNWWTTITLCVSLVLSIAGTAAIAFKKSLFINKRYLFYGMCGLDVIETICISTICSRIGRINYSYQTDTYQFLDKIGDAINYHSILSVACIVLIVALHCYVMFRLYKLNQK